MQAQMLQHDGSVILFTGILRKAVSLRAARISFTSRSLIIRSRVEQILQRPDFEESVYIEPAGSSKAEWLVLRCLVIKEKCPWLQLKLPSLLEKIIRNHLLCFFFQTRFMHGQGSKKSTHCKDWETRVNHGSWTNVWHSFLAPSNEARETNESKLFFF